MKQDKRIFREPEALVKLISGPCSNSERNVHLNFNE